MGIETTFDCVLPNRWMLRIFHGVACWNFSVRALLSLQNSSTNNRYEESLGMHAKGIRFDWVFY